MKKALYILLAALVLTGAAACKKDVEPNTDTQEIQNQEEINGEMKEKLPTQIVDIVKSDLESKGWDYVTSVNGPMESSGLDVLWQNAEVDPEEGREDPQYNIVAEYVDENKNAVYAIVRITFADTEYTDGAVSAITYVNEAGNVAKHGQFGEELIDATDSRLAEYMK